MRTRRPIHRFPALAAGLLTAAALPAALAAERSEKGITLVVPTEHAAMGKVYHALVGKDAQVTFTSDAPLEHIKSSSNRVVGYAVVKDPAAGPGIVAGEFRLPVASFDTGIPMRNEHLQGERWMDAKGHPDIVFTMSAFNDARLEKEGEGFKTWSGSLAGKMTIKGVTRDMTIPARVTLRPESAASKARAPGDLMAIRCAYTVKMSDFGIGVDDPAKKAGKVADEVELETMLFLSTVNPESAMPPGGGRQGGQGQGAQQGGQSAPAPAPGGEKKPEAPAKP